MEEQKKHDQETQTNEGDEQSVGTSMINDVLTR